MQPRHGRRWTLRTQAVDEAGGKRAELEQAGWVVTALATLPVVMLTLAHDHLTWVNEVITLAICGSYLCRSRHRRRTSH